jgi:hypothetical protein
MRPSLLLLTTAITTASSFGLTRPALAFTTTAIPSMLFGRGFYSGSTSSSSLKSASSAVYRPTSDDVERISRGLASKKRGTGSRAVPHRLNEEERTLYQIAQRKGFCEIGGSGYRRERGDSPLANTWRLFSDSRGHPSILMHKSSNAVEGDEVFLDLSPLRLLKEGAFRQRAVECIGECFGAEGGVIVADDVATPASPLSGLSSDDDNSTKTLDDDYSKSPIHALPKYLVHWTRPRSEAKSLAKALAQYFWAGGGGSR